MTVRRLRTSWPAILIASALLAAGCHATPPSSGASPVGGVTRATAGYAVCSRDVDPPSHCGSQVRTMTPDNPINHVIAISIDGLNPDAIKQLGKSGTPAFHRLMREGAYTLNARTVREKTSTLPNHTAMLTGRRVDSKHGGHGYSENSTMAGRSIMRPGTT